MTARQILTRMWVEAGEVYPDISVERDYWLLKMKDMAFALADEIDRLKAGTTPTGEDGRWETDFNAVAQLWRGKCGHHWLKDEIEDCPICPSPITEEMIEIGVEKLRQAYWDDPDMGGIPAINNEFDLIETIYKAMRALEK